MIARWCESKGVAVRTGTRVTEIVRGNGSQTLASDRGEPIEADLVVCAIGVSPNIGFFDGAGIECDAGILVYHRLRTSAADVYAAGANAQGPDFSNGRREVHAIQPTAVEHGRIAALNMAGVDSPFRGSLSMNVLNTGPLCPVPTTGEMLDGAAACGEIAFELSDRGRLQSALLTA